MSNGPSDVTVSLELEFKIFDQLPRELRDALNYSWENYAVHHVRILMRLRHYTPTEVIDLLKRKDREFATEFNG